MRKTNRADAVLAAIGSEKTVDSLANNQLRLSKNHNRSKSSGTQCLKCGSDYLRFAVNGYCQSCQQRVEYILRETKQGDSGPSIHARLTSKSRQGATELAQGGDVMTEKSHLSAKHLSKLKTESAISEGVITARGYKTITRSGDLAEYGFGRYQRRVPSLLIPVRGPDGYNTLYQIRPDSPRQRNGKALKYEMPVGSTMRIDCPPKCLPEMGDPNTTLWVTEGVLKGDSLASHGLCSIALLGVWNFKAKNEFGAVTISADFDFIALKGRQVRIVFDSDVMTKAPVRNALDRLTEVLSRKGAIVSTVYLPNNPDGSKVGVDDYLREHSVAELEALVSGPQQPIPVPTRTIELLDYPPEVLHRPLQIIEGRAYVATWLHVKVTETEGLDKDGKVVRHEPAKVSETRQMFIMRDDGKMFGEGGDLPISDLQFECELKVALRDRTCMSKQAVMQFREGRTEEISVLHKNIASVFNQFVDFDGSLADQRTMCDLAACYAVATWFIEGFNVAGYIYPTGPAGSGKTQFLNLMCQVAYLGEFVQASGSFAAIRDLSNYGGFLGFDDAENVTSRNFDPDKRNILLSGNKRGSQIPLKEPDPSGKGWVTKYVDTFAFRGFSAIRSPDSTLGSRTITVPLIRTSNKRKGDADPLDCDLWPVSPGDIRSHAWQIALRHLSEMPAIERKTKKRASLTGRNLEAWIGVLSVAALIDSKTAGSDLFNRMNALSVSFQNLRHDIEATDVTRLILRSLVYCIQPAAVEPFNLNELIAVSGSREWIISTQMVARKAIELISNEDLDCDPRALDTRRVGRALSKLRFQRQSDGKRRGYSVKAAALEKHLQAYCLLRGGPGETDVSDVFDVTDVDESSGNAAGTFEPANAAVVM